MKRILAAISILLLSLPVAAQWTTQSLGTSNNVNSVNFFGTTDIWITSGSGLHKSTNNGSSFTTYPLQMSSGTAWLTSSLNDVAIINSTTAFGAGFFFLGNDEFIVKTIDGGAHWDSSLWVSNTFLAEHRAVDFPTATTGYVAGWQGRVFKTTNGGASWSLPYFNTAVTWQDMIFTSANEGVIAGDGGIIRTTNGVAFNQVLTTTGTLNAVDMIGTTGFAGGSTSSGMLFKTTDGGATWTSLSFNYGDVRALSMINASTIVVATVNELYKSTDGGIYWEKFALPSGTTPVFTNVNFRDANTGYAVGNSGYCIKTSNGGGSTFPISAFTSPSGPYCEGNTYTFTNTTNPSYSFQWLLNNNVIGTSYNLNYTFNVPGNNTLALVSYNGVNYDTVSQSIIVNAQHFVNPLVYDLDTICPGGAATIEVFNSQTGISYLLRNGLTAIGSAQNGNGGTLTFNAGVFQQSTLLNIKASGSNACYNDSVITTFNQIAFPDKTIPITVTDSLICSGVEQFHAAIGNTQTGVSYLLIRNGIQLDSIGGTGGSITLTAPLVYGMSVSSFMQIVAYSSSTCAPTMRNVNITIDTVYARANVINPNVLPGDTINFINNSYADSYSWTFPAQANIQTSALAYPSVIFNTAGYYPVSVIASNQEGCSDTLVMNVSVGTPAPSGVVDFCGMGQVNPSNLTTYDMHLDADKNVYATGSYLASFTNYPTLFVSKTDSLGVLQWYREAVNYSSSQSSGFGVTSDDHGNVYVAGNFAGKRIFIGSTTIFTDTITSSKGILIKFDKDGNPLWTIAGIPANNSGNGCWASDVVSGNNGRIYFTGGQGNGYFLFPDNSTHQGNGNNNQAYIMTIDTSGNFIGYSNFGATSGGSQLISEPGFRPVYQSPRIDKMQNGNLAVASAFVPATGTTMQVTIGTSIFTDTVTTVYTGIFNTVTGWSNAARIVSGDITILKDITTDNAGNIFLSGLAKRKLKYNNTLLNLDTDQSGATLNYYSHSFLVAANSAGVVQWLRQSRFGIITAIDVTPTGELLFAAYAGNKGNFQSSNSQPQSVTTVGQQDFVIGKYNLAGDLLFANVKGTTQYDVPFAIASDPCGDVVVMVSENRTSVTAWPALNTSSAGGTVSVQRYSKDGFCSRDAFCAGYDVDTLSEDAALVSVWLSDTLAGAAPVPVSIRLKTLGVNPLTSAQVIVQDNGVTKITYNWAGALDQYETIDSINVGNISFTGGGLHNIKAWVQLPNGSVDLNHLNDTVQTSIDVCLPLSGSYTIGAGGDFESFSKAIEHIKTCGLGGHTYMNVLPGVYTDRMLLADIPSGLTDSLVFQSANGDSSSVVLEAGLIMPYSNAIVEVWNSNYITLKSMTIRNLDVDPSVNMVIRMTGTSSHFNLLNCIVTRSNPDTTASDFLFSQGGGAHHYTNIRNNLFLYGDWAVSIFGAQTNCVIANNRFLEQTGSAIFFQDALNPTIRDNYIETNFHQSNVYFGVASSASPQGFTVTDNKIIVNNGNGYGFAFGGLCGGATPGLLYNNMVSITQSDNNSFGVQLSNTSGNIKILYNTFLIDGASATSAGIYFSDNVTNAIEVKNNIFTLRDNGLCMWFTGNFAASFQSDYNVFYTNGNVFAKSGAFPQTVITSPDLASWQTYSANELHSVFHNPGFASSTDLHLAAGGVINGMGTPLPTYVTVDYDGEPRSALTPDPGCDEFVAADTLVWPGDCNYDGIANNYDALSIGLYFNQTGTARSVVSNSWSGQPSTDWGALQYCGYDKKHADSNGDGVITWSDTTAINQNWGLSHPLRVMQDFKTSSVGPLLYFIVQNDTVSAGDTVTVEIHAGTAANQVAALYGISFDVNFDPSLAAPGTLELTYSPSWIGVPNINAITTANVSSAVSGSIVRINGADTSGYGEIAQFRFVVDQGLTQVTNLTLSMDNFVAIQANGNIVSMTPFDTDITFTPATGIAESGEALSWYPNPANDFIYINLQSRNISEIRLVDVLGKEVFRRKISKSDESLRLDVGDLATGVYTLIAGEQKSKVIIR